MKPLVVAARCLPVWGICFCLALLWSPQSVAAELALPGDLVAEIDTPFHVIFPDGSWVYLGCESDEGFGSAVSLSAKQPVDGTCRFTFQALDSGSHALRFQLQDLSAGQLRNHIVTVRISPSGVEDAPMAGADRSEPVIAMSSALSTEQTPDFRFAESLLRMNRLHAALKEFERYYRPGDPYLSDRIAGIHYLLEEYELAKSYWQRNLATDSEYREQAVLGLMRTAVSQREVMSAVELLPRLFSLESAQLDGIFGLTTEFLREEGEMEVLRGMLLEYAVRYPSGGSIDEAYYRLGRLYEQNNSWRNLKLSRDYYSLIVKNYPESEFWSPSDQRVRYLDRHFFRIW